MKDRGGSGEPVWNGVAGRAAGIGMCRNGNDSVERQRKEEERKKRGRKRMKDE